MKNIIIFAAACAALASCSKIGTDVTPAKDGMMTLSANMGGGNSTKVTPGTLDGTTAVSYTWESTDKIYITPTGASAPLEFSVVPSSINGSSANFTGETFDVSKGYTVEYKGNTSYLEGTFKPFAQTASEVKTTSFSLVILPVVQFTLTADVNLTLKSIEMSAKYGGHEYGADFSFGEGLAISSTGSKTVYVPCPFWDCSFTFYREQSPTDLGHVEPDSVEIGKIYKYDLKLVTYEK